MPLSVNERLHINNLVNNFLKNPSEKLALLIYQAIPLSSKKSWFNMSLSHTQKNESTYSTEYGLVEDDAEEKVRKTLFKTHHHRCGNYKIRKDINLIQIWKFNDIDDEGEPIIPFENGDKTSLSITFRNNIPRNWGYNVYSSRHINLFFLTLDFSDSIYHPQEFKVDV